MTAPRTWNLEPGTWDLELPSGSYRWRWSHVDESGRAAGYVELLNRARPDDDPAHVPNTLAWIDAQPGERILEVGCGNGAIARAVCRQVPDIRELIAVDSSAAMIAAAQEQLASRKLPVTFAVADAHALPFEDGAFDRCYATEIFVILPDPMRALDEMIRVTRPSGQIRIWESDCDARAILASDLELARRIMRFVGDHEYNGAVARQIIGRLKQLGWHVSFTPAVSVIEDDSFPRDALLPEWLADAQDAGVVTVEEAQAFLAEMEQRIGNGSYFSYQVNFRIAATKPV